MGICATGAAVVVLGLLVYLGAMPPALALAAAGAALVFLVELGLTFLTTVAGRDLRIWRRGIPQLRVALWLALVGARLVGRDREQILHSFIRNNNLLVRAVLRGKGARRAATSRRLLVLAPTCLQSQGCDKDVTHEPSLCERCGKCPIKDLVELADERGLELHFVGGGTLARALVERSAPEAVVAVACERELMEGILFSRRVPVLGIPNTRPKGPCKETQVDVAEVREAIEALGS